MLEQIVHHIGIDVAAYVGAAIAGLAGYYASKGLRAYKDWTRKRYINSIPKLLSKDIGVYKFLTELLVETNADRAYVMMFHNGIFYINKGSQMKVSCTHEIVRTGVSREQDNMQEMLTSKFAEPLTELIAHRTAIFKIDENGSSDSYYNQMKRTQGVKTSISSIMKDGDIVEGLVSINYLEGNKMVDADLSFEKKLVEDAADRVGFLLRKDHE